MSSSLTIYKREKSLEKSHTSGSSTEFNHASSSLGNLTKEEDQVLSRIESAASAVYDPASKVPTNASRESGIIGIHLYQLC